MKWQLNLYGRRPLCFGVRVYLLLSEVAWPIVINLSNTFGRSFQKIDWPKKHQTSKLRPDFWQLCDLLANISGLLQVNRKTASQLWSPRT